MYQYWDSQHTVCSIVAMWSHAGLQRVSRLFLAIGCCSIVFVQHLRLQNKNVFLVLSQAIGHGGFHWSQTVTSVAPTTTVSTLQ